MMNGKDRVAYSRKPIRAATLLEVMVVVAIVLVLVGLLLGVFLSAKDRSKVVVDISNMHQLGIAGAIYASDFDDRPPLSALPLLMGDYVDDRIVVSPTDSSDVGLAIQFRQTIGLPVDKYLSEVPKLTYIGPGEGDWTLEFYQANFKDEPNQGWLVDLTRNQKEDPNMPIDKGRYQRLLFDASVVTRTMGVEVVNENGLLGERFNFKDYFADSP